MKKLYFLDEEEKNRILNLHESATKRHYLGEQTKPTQAELDAAWPQVDYQNKVTAIQTSRRLAYEAQSDGLFFEWQRGDNTEAAWRAAVAAVKAAYPYPPEA